MSTGLIGSLARNLSLSIITGVTALMVLASSTQAEEHAKTPATPAAPAASETETPKSDTPKKEAEAKPSDSPDDSAKADESAPTDEPEETTQSDTPPADDVDEADTAQLPVDDFTTNQDFIEGLQDSNDIRIESVEDALAHVFERLPERVFVHPTENYYYFTFSAGGVVYAGNLRLAARDRDKGIIHFAAFPQANQANKVGKMYYKALTEEDGVTVEKQDGLAYKVTYGGKSVHFELNDVSDIEPPKEIIAEGEKYLGLVSDESGLRFFFFYNEIDKVFAYVLDESSPLLDEFKPTQKDSRILIGHRTGFAFYDHHFLDRRVLIGVHGGNTVVNNYLDGPADQLPENHIKDDWLRKSLVDQKPELKGLLDGFGYFKSGEGRYLIAPYMQYNFIEELKVYDECASNPDLDPAQYNGCFISEQS